VANEKIDFIKMMIVVLFKKLICLPLSKQV
jgi:hypothetical protein